MECCPLRELAMYCPHCIAVLMSHAMYRALGCSHARSSMLAS